MIRTLRELHQWISYVGNTKARDLKSAQALRLYWHTKALFSQVLQEKNSILSMLNSITTKLDILQVEVAKGDVKKIVLAKELWGVKFALRSWM